MYFLPGAQQHLLGLVDQFFLGNPEKQQQQQKDYKNSFTLSTITTMEIYKYWSTVYTDVFIKSWLDRLKQADKTQLSGARDSTAIQMLTKSHTNIIYTC